MEINELYNEFFKESGIDLKDTEVTGKFPKFNQEKQKWGYIERGKAWQLYAEFLQSKLTRPLPEREEMIERAKEFRSKFDDIGFMKLYNDSVLIFAIDFALSEIKRRDGI